MRVIGLDVSRSVAEIAYLENGLLRAGGRVGLRRDELERFAAKLKPDDHVILEATGNTIAIANVLTGHVGRVIVANPLQVRLIAEARVKTDKIDAAILAQLYASGFLPEVWIPDEATQAMRRQVSRRAQNVRQRTRLKNEIHAVLAAHLIERCPATDLFGKKGRAWLSLQPLPMDERLGIDQRLHELDRHRRYRSLSLAGETGQLLWPQSFGLPIRLAASKARTHQQAGTFLCACHAGRGCLGRSPNGRPRPSLLHTCPRSSRSADRGRCHGTQARDHRLARPHA
ncbi:hypothetical protein CBM2634_U530002 [Cupriavidus taiwanensis]|uniref:Transposase IS110-like N-terminal domain-containing protein n=1 Tax=Cupriavidus taiwanensis TaxID=164546 RepID=A0A375JCS7_9BURK|nr:hypothetical protein CBM2634_U530002 [Cupriavidus taiwanensis]